MEKGKHLVICFSSSSYCPNPAFYSFQSFPISELIGTSLKRKHSDSTLTGEEIQLLNPKEKFLWCDEDDTSNACKPHYMNMMFLHTRGSIYAVGGNVNNMVSMRYRDPPSCEWDININLHRITFSSSLGNPKVELMKQMGHFKYRPIIVEIDGLIYVLSQSPYSPHEWHGVCKCNFEVYNPVRDVWESLDDPPFIKFNDGIYCFDRCAHGYVVIDGMLCVTTGFYSSAFNTKTRLWGPCDLFSGGSELLHPNVMHAKQWLMCDEGKCSPPFPFVESVLFCKKDIILCRRDAVEEPYLVAFKIIKGDDNKSVAKRAQLRFPEYEGYVTALVDIGDGCFAAFVIEFGEDCLDQLQEMTIITFKAVSKMDENGRDSLECEVLKKTRCSRIEVVGMTNEDLLYPLHSFIW